MPSTRHLGARQARRQRNLLVAVGMLLLAVMLLVGFYLGQRAAFSGMGMDTETYRAMEARIPELQGEISRLEGEIEVQRTRQEVDQQATCGPGQSRVLDHAQVDLGELLTPARPDDADGHSKQPPMIAAISEAG